MPLGEPQGPTQTVWKITAASLATIGDYQVRFEMVATTDNPNDPAMPGIVQAFVDHIAASDDFRVLNAMREYTYLEQMTPTA